MGADLFGSFAEATCAALVIGAQNPDLVTAGWSALMFPLIVSGFGLMVCLLCSFVATHIKPVMLENEIELGLRMQLILTTILMIPVTWVTVQWLPNSFTIIGVAKTFKMYQMDAFACVVIGCVGGLIIGLCTEYYTSKEFSPVMDLVKSTKTGAGTNIIYGLSLGYKSTIVPIFILAGIIYISFERGDLYGVALCACGMLSNLATGLTIDAYGPVTDNAGGIAEMSGLPAEVRQKTDALDAAGNTTAAVGKGFAIGSAALVSLALFGAFSVRIRTTAIEDNYVISAHEILSPIIFSFLLIGSMIPYWFSALTMKSVGSAAMLMVAEVERQFKANPELLEENSTARPDYSACVKISTEASLKEMIAPAALIIATPLITGTFFGIYALSGLLTGSLLSSVLLAISMSNTGGAWDNCKKYIELNPSEEYGGKGGECHKGNFS
jgi:inorganic pyrophosphatase